MVGVDVITVGNFEVECRRRGFALDRADYGKGRHFHDWAFHPEFFLSYGAKRQTERKGQQEYPFFHLGTW
jgi:hypothetical protein